VLIYDGDCGFCTQTVLWLQARLTTPITVVPWQEIHDLRELGLTEADVSTAVYWVDAYGRLSRGHLAAARALTLVKGPLSILGWIGLVPPATWVTAPAYKLVARFRYRMPGATAACAIPQRSTPFIAPAATATPS
jgi:predicted DCC family thiol-disulfide oxidoreductase YuxK